MDSNNNSSNDETNEITSVQDAQQFNGVQIKTEFLLDSKQQEDNQDKQDRLELFANYDVSDMLGQDSGTQTPVGAGEIQTNNNNNNNNTTNNNNNNNNYNDNNTDHNSDVSKTNPGVIRIQESESGGESIEIELEKDNSLLLSSLTSLFPDATGLKFRHPETNTFRGVKLADGKFLEPNDGWSAVQNYICVCSKGSKRKNDDDDSAEGNRKFSKTDSGKQATDGSDLVVLGLPWSTTEESMKTYFEQHGEVTMVQVKTDPKSGKSRGFGFVRFAKSSVQQKLLSMRHFIDGRWCDVRVPLSKSEADATKAAQLSRKIFVGRLPDNISTDDLRSHFSEYGTLTDVFIPRPFRNFAFVTFGTADMAQSIFKHRHVIKGSQVQISEAIPRDNGPNNNNNHNYGGGGSGGGYSGNSNSGGSYGYAGNSNNNIHPFNNYVSHHQAPSHHHHHFHNKSNLGGANYGGPTQTMYQNTRKIQHPQSSSNYYQQMPSYGTSTTSSVGLDSTPYINQHGSHNDYGSFATTGVSGSSYGQPSGTSGINGGQYYKMQQQQPQQQQQPIMNPNQSHNSYPNQSSYSNQGSSNFSRSSYGSVWK